MFHLLRPLPRCFVGLPLVLVFGALSVCSLIAEDRNPVRLPVLKEKLPWVTELDIPRDQVWRPKDTFDGTETVNAPLVSYGNDWTRNGFGGHVKQQCTFRSPWRREAGITRSEADPFVIEHKDVDGDGDTQDDYIAAIPFNMDVPFNIPDWPQGGVYPHREAAQFYGGAVWEVANAPIEEHGQKLDFTIEMGINPDHQGPFYDDRAEDHPLNGQPFSTNPQSFVRNDWLFLWKKEDFWNGADRGTVAFNEDSYLATMIARYWYNVNTVRMVVQDGDRFFVSEYDFWKTPAEEVIGGWTDLNEQYRIWNVGRVFKIRPTETRWAEYNPEAMNIRFDRHNAEYRDHDFKDVRAVGWYISKDDDGKAFFHVKWYTFEAVGEITRPKRPSEYIDMVPVGGAGVPFFISTCEVPYLLWREVFRFADSPSYTLIERGSFLHYGDMGSMLAGDGPHTADEPVTNIDFYDTLAWCNGLSERAGREPCYYTDPEFKNVFRFDEIETRATYENPPAQMFTENPVYETKPLPAIYVKWSADGYRLPTVTEWEAAAGELAAEKAPGRTLEVGSGKPNAKGLYDMGGNVWEYVWSFDDDYHPDKDVQRLALGGDFNFPANKAASPFGDKPWDGNYNIGFRLVRREAGAPAPAFAEPSLPGDRRWVFGGDTLLPGDGKPIPTPVLDMVAIPEGSYHRGSEKLEISLLPFHMGRTEVSFDQWRKVLFWGEANGYNFDTTGAMGSMNIYNFAHSPDEPVTGLLPHDALTWCNALSEMEGRTPCYYTDPEMTQVYRDTFRLRPIKEDAHSNALNVHGKKYERMGRREPWIFVRYDTDGYRLPSAAEWEYAARGGHDDDWFLGPEIGPEILRYAWLTQNAKGRTHPVGKLEANGYGLHDMIGNVWEATLSNNEATKSKSRLYMEDVNNPKWSRYYTYGDSSTGGVQKEAAFTMGGSFLTGEGEIQAGKMRWRPDETSPDTGLRVVRFEAGVQPRDGLFPLKKRVVIDKSRGTFDLLN